MDKRKVSTVQTMDLKKAASYLEDLLDAFKKGTITVTKGEENVVLSPASPVFLEIEAKKRQCPYCGILNPTVTLKDVFVGMAIVIFVMSIVTYFVNN